ncbi:MAG: hypothetical protein RL557_151 [archaeon]|jgi:hypothetical protein
MVNENIITALHNAVQRGEPLDQAMSILINSGYNAQEVKEASQFVGQGAIPLLEPKKDEQLLPTQNIAPLMPAASSPISFLKKLHFFKTPTIEASPQKSTQTNQAATTPEKPKKRYTKEIILLIVLLVLIGILITTIMFKEQIIGFLAG